MILVIDNYDSFTYNLVQYLGELGAEIEVYRNDRITLGRVTELSPEKILISPGPGSPKDAGVSKDVIKKFGGRVPVLGVCLGHQAIAEVYGSNVIRACHIMHGKVSRIYHNGDGIFKGIPSPFVATRYHSLIVEPDSLKPPLYKTAWTEDGEIMGIAHEKFPMWGVQFHPESILTSEGKEILKNFLDVDWNKAGKR